MNRRVDVIDDQETWPQVIAEAAGFIGLFVVIVVVALFASGTL